MTFIEEFTPFLAFPPEVRRVTCTTFSSRAPQPDAAQDRPLPEGEPVTQPGCGQTLRTVQVLA
jgi:hypothetical protein